MRRTWQQALLVFQEGFCHLDCGCRWRVECGAGFQQANDFGAAVACALHDRVKLVLCRPTHLHQIRQGNTCNCGITLQWHHRVAVAAQNKGGHVAHGDVEFFGKEVTEACGIQNTSHAANHVCGRPENSRSAQTIASSGLVMQITNAFGAWAAMPSPTDFITLRLMPKQVITAHARLACEHRLSRCKRLRLRCRRSRWCL